jgi:hypothetical protein
MKKELAAELTLAFHFSVGVDSTSLNEVRFFAVVVRYIICI